MPVATITPNNPAQGQGQGATNEGGVVVTPTGAAPATRADGSVADPAGAGDAATVLAKAKAASKVAEQAHAVAQASYTNAGCAGTPSDAANCSSLKSALDDAASAKKRAAADVQNAETSVTATGSTDDKAASWCGQDDAMVRPLPTSLCPCQPVPQCPSSMCRTISLSHRIVCVSFCFFFGPQLYVSPFLAWGATKRRRPCCPIYARSFPVC